LKLKQTNSNNAETENKIVINFKNNKNNHYEVLTHSLAPNWVHGY